MRRVGLLLAFVFCFAVAVSAQPVSEEPTTVMQWYSSLTGIVAATILAVGILKRLLAKVPVANQVPLWVYSIVVSSVLIYLTNRVWQTLPGELWPLLTQAVMTAATASGFYEWFTSADGGAVKSLTKPLADSHVSQDIIHQ